MASFQLCFSLFVFTIITAFSGGGVSGHNFPATPLFIFGDSMYDAGNNNYINTSQESKSNFLPYGKNFKFATGRFSNGLIIPDFIAKYANLPLIPPYFMSGYRQFGYGVNFASGGGGVLDETKEDLQVINLNQQLMYFKDVENQLRKFIGDKETSKLLGNAVYMFCIGSNDLLSPNPIFSNFSSQDYIQMIVGNFTSVVKELYKIGGRKFGFINLIPLHMMPHYKAHPWKKTNMVDQYSYALSIEYKKLEKQLKGFFYSKFDIHNASLEMIQNPSKYGFKDVENACCGSGIYRGNYSCGGTRGERDYDVCNNAADNFYFDSFHPSQKASRQLAKWYWAGPSKFTGPYTLKALFEYKR